MKVVVVAPLLLVLSIVCSFIFPSTNAWGTNQDKIKLTELQVLTLNQGIFTNGRRSAGVPQLKCIGGSAGCSAFVPSTVQCRNQGSDGYDVQWECKTDMPNEFKFGKVEVSCEGFDYPDDPYVLKGSCGLEYTIDYSKNTGAGYAGFSQGYQQSAHPESSSGFSNLLVLVAVCLIVYAIYVTCIAPTDHTDARSRTNDDFQGRPPPPGFRSDYYPSGGSAPGNNDGFGFGGDSCSRGAGTSSAGAGTGGGGFWTGAATGGLLGYMFGRNNNQSGAYYGAGPSTSYFRSAPSQNAWGGFGGSSSSGSTSSGSRSASGYGGTKRR